MGYVNYRSINKKRTEQMERLNHNAVVTKSSGKLWDPSADRIVQRQGKRPRPLHPSAAGFGVTPLVVPSDKGNSWRSYSAASHQRTSLPVAGRTDIFRLNMGDMVVPIFSISHQPPSLLCQQCKPKNQSSVFTTFWGLALG